MGPPAAARHPGKQPGSAPGRGNLVLPGPARAADHRHHPAARPRHHPRPLRPAGRRPPPLPAPPQRRPRRRRIPAPVLPGRRQAPTADLPAAPGLTVTTRRARQGVPATGRTTADLPPDRDHHRPRHRRPLPPGPALRQPPPPPPPGTAPPPRQAPPSATPAWHARYATLRNTIEGLNGYLKDPAHQAVAQPGRRRVRGLAAPALFTALLLAAASIRKIRAWRALTAGDKTAIARRARRRRASLPSYRPDS